MERMYNRLRPKQTLLLILLPMLATFVGQRLYLHLVRVQHVYPAGYLAHHLFSGALLVIAAGFVLAFGTRNRVLMRVSAVSLGGSVALISLAVVTLVVLHHCTATGRYD